MRTYVPWRFGAASALTVLTGYVVCTVIWFLLTEPSMTFLNGLFHGLDFRRLYVSREFDSAAWVLALAVLGTWAFLMGALYAQLRNWLHVERALQ